MRRAALARVLALLALGVLAALAYGAPATAPGPRPHASATLAGRLLVATEALGDPHFAHTVVYVVRHDETGAMGLVLNRPLGDVPMSRLLEKHGLRNDGAAGSVRVHSGGPVEPGRGFVLHTPDYAAEGTWRVSGGLAVSVDPAVLGAIARGSGPRRFLLCFGYAGWAAHQLEDEIDAGAWFTAPADAALVFDPDDAHKWQRALALRKIDI